MLRKVIGSVFVLLVAVGIVFAADFTGKFKKIEKAKEKGQPATLTVTGDDGKDKDFKMGKGVKYFDVDKEVDAKEAKAFRNEKLKEGVKVKVVTDKDGNVTEIRVNPK
jgi:hypothetical protein